MTQTSNGGSAPFAGTRVHLIGIGGCGMSAAARVLLRQGAVVSGSDVAATHEVVMLRQAGATIAIGQRPQNLPPDADLVVYTAAITPDNPELVEARRQRRETIKYAALLGRLMRGRDGIAVAGTHGKSTTTALTAFVLKQAGADPSFVVGAHVDQLDGASGVGDGPHFVVEACEYDRSFLQLAPRFATILNIEEDHLDCYRDLHDIVDAFDQFAALVPSDGALVVNGENRAALDATVRAVVPIDTFGFADTNVWQATDLTLDGGCFRFVIRHHGAPVATTHMSIPGRHNVANALAATALCWRAGLSAEQTAEILPHFHGAKRRMTVVGANDDITILDDYAHHPTEIEVTLRATRERYQPRCLWVVFQPHQHSRTRFLLTDFARSLGQADRVVVPDIYFVRDSEAERDRITARDLVEQIHLRGGDGRYEPSFTRIVEQLVEEVAPGDVVIAMGAGDVWRVAYDLASTMGLTTDNGKSALPKALRDAG